MKNNLLSKISLSSGLAIAFATRPANTVAGDYYDVFARPSSVPGEARFLLAVADVAGKSIPAALLMATFQASLKTLSAIHCSLTELVTGMNEYACTNSQGGLRFTTAFLAEFEAVVVFSLAVWALHPRAWQAIETSV
jgi:sigma-B regulation protein RsbU (phosphoserine phosphatase)